MGSVNEVAQCSLAEALEQAITVMETHGWIQGFDDIMYRQRDIETGEYTKCYCGLGGVGLGLNIDMDNLLYGDLKLMIHTRDMVDAIAKVCPTIHNPVELTEVVKNLEADWSNHAFWGGVGTPCVADAIIYMNDALRLSLQEQVAWLRERGL